MRKTEPKNVKKWQTDNFMKKLLVILGSLFASLQILDLYITWVGLNLGALEGNPFLTFPEINSVTIGFKIIGIVAGSVFFYLIYQHRGTFRGRLYLTSMIGLIAYLLFVVINNLFWIMRLS